jgi:ElaB/YqjD/DUF883 family membrane-anchored ribosome-binding protein
MAQHMFASLGETADRKLHALAESSREKLEEIKNKNLGDIARDTKSWVRHNPVKMMVGVATAGILLGWALGRRR